MQTDPVGYQDNTNLYSYGPNDPMNGKDETGEIWGAIIGAVVDAAVEVATQVASGEEIDWGDVAVAAAEGAVIGAVTGGVGNIVKAGKNIAKVAKVVKKGSEAAKKGAKGGPRAGKRHTQAAKKKNREDNRAENDGKLKCETCGKEMVEPKQRVKGEPVARNEAQSDHIEPRSKGGDGATVKDQRNIDQKCMECNLKKSDKDPF